jgi:hypothetical protein
VPKKRADKRLLSFRDGAQRRTWNPDTIFV